MQDAGFNLEDVDTDFCLLYFKSGINQDIQDQEAPGIEAIYIDQAKKIANSLKKKLKTFIKISCYHEINNFINKTSLMGPLINLDCNLQDIEGDYFLDFSKVKKILNAPEHNILYPAIITTANKLNIGNINATYEVYCTGFASYEYNIQSAFQGKRLSFCKFQYPSVKYSVQLNYEFPEILLIIPLITLHFECELKTKYSLINSDDLAQYIEQHTKLVNDINTRPIKELTFFWDHSILIKKDKVNYNDPTIDLIKLNSYTIDYILKNNCLECQRIKRILLEENYGFYYSQLSQILKDYQSILIYAGNAGVDKAQINSLHYFDSKKFAEDFIDLPLIAGPGKYKSKINLLDKYTNIIKEPIFFLHNLNLEKNNKNTIEIANSFNSSLLNVSYSSNANLISNQSSNHIPNINALDNSNDANNSNDSSLSQRHISSKARVLFKPD